MRLLRDPLLHFLAGGLILFLVYDLSLADRNVGVASDPRRIVVDESALLRFIEYRSKNFDEVTARKRLDQAPPAELQDLIRDYLSEEVLYRTALSLGLDRDDYVIRRRLVQKVNYMAEGVGSAVSGITPVAAEAVELQAYYENHIRRYEQPARVTFTHVFFNANIRSAVDAAELAAATLPQLNEQPVAFSGAAAFGERFLYQLNYVERPFEEVAAHFGESAAVAIFALRADERNWAGPIQSEHGAHLVLLRESAKTYLPELEDVLEEVRADYQADKAAERRRTFTDQLLAGFKVEFAPALQPVIAGLRADSGS